MFSEIVMMAPFIPFEKIVMLWGFSGKSGAIHDIPTELNQKNNEISGYYWLEPQTAPFQPRPGLIHSAQDAKAGGPSRRSSAAAALALALDASFGSVLGLCGGYTMGADPAGKGRVCQPGRNGQSLSERYLPP